MSVQTAPNRQQVERTLDAAVERLLALQTPAGWWKGELETNVTIDAEDLFLRSFLGLLEPRQLESSARWIRHRQRDDGSWANFHAGPADLSTTTEAYAALRLAGDAAELPHMRAARAVIHELGGLERARVFTKIWFSLLGLWDWEHVPVLPPEMIFLPAWAPLNIYDFACWARQTIVPLCILSACRPVRPIGFAVPELRAGGPPVPPPADGWGRAFTAVDGVLARYQRRPHRGLRRRAIARAVRWIVERQEADGSWGGIQPPWVYSLMALDVCGFAPDHPVMRRGLQGLDGFTVEENGYRRLEACQSPVWDSALAAIALLDAGLPASHPALESVREWLVGEEVGIAGDWAVRRPTLRPSGWAFEFANDHYPDIDDSAVVALALHRLAPEESGRTLSAVRRGTAWVAGMQSSDGGWGAFDAENTRTLCRRPPFCDFGEVIDPPSVDVTAHVVELLASTGDSGEPMERGVRHLLANQEPDGSWFGRWGANLVYGTGAVVPALRAAGVGADHPAVRHAVRFLEQAQNEDGGWGEDLRSYTDPGWRARGHSTASQTAWALLALDAAGTGGEAADRGVRWLAEHQRGDGSWDEPHYTGTGFPGFFYINYHLYRLVFPVMALGRLRGAP
ncbi:MAG TPA: squalene--hopene cyclase [Gaiellales bacterium]|nr:squalene--hopene cyclase [Gaiellales bacterium]